jgi:hypothetical protein
MLTINGATVTSKTDSGSLSLQTAAGDNVPLGSTSAGSYSVRAIPGSYDIYYRVTAAGATAPLNKLAKIRTGAVVGTGTTALDIDVPVSPVTGSIRINGTTSTSSTDYGTLSLNNGGDSAILGPSYSGTYSALIVPGTYDLTYQVGQAGALAPRNSQAVLRCFTVR